jgi:signal transduction histidine kinase
MTNDSGSLSDRWSEESSIGALGPKLSGLSGKPWLSEVIRTYRAAGGALWELSKSANQLQMSIATPVDPDAYSVPVGRGLVGSAVKANQVMRWSVASPGGISPYNQGLIDSQGWSAAIAVPYKARLGSGALTLYFRDDVVFRRIGDTSTIMLAAAAAGLYDYRHATEVRSERETRLEEQVEIVATGVAMIEFVHDIAHVIKPFDDSLGALVSGVEGGVPRSTQLRVASEVKSHLDTLESLLGAMTRSLRRRGDKPVSTDVKKVIDELVPLFESRSKRDLNGRRLTVETKTGSTPLRVNAKHGEIERVLINLFVNSLFWTNQVKRAGVITIGCSLEGEECVVIVSDNGPGVPDDLKARVMDPFVSTRGGIGMGLTFVRRALDDMGATYDLRGNFGDGLAFEMRLPVSNA